MSGDPSSLIIRPATVADVELLHSSLLGIARTVGELDKVRCSVADLVEFGFGSDPHFEALVAEVDGVYAGMCLYFRSLGVGRKLLRRVAAIVRDRGGVYLRLSVDTQNFIARDFYTRLEIKPSDTEQVHAAYEEAFLNLAAADCPQGGTLQKGSA